MKETSVTLAMRINHTSTLSYLCLSHTPSPFLKILLAFLFSLYLSLFIFHFFVEFVIPSFFFYFYTYKNLIVGQHDTPIFYSTKALVAFLFIPPKTHTRFLSQKELES